MEQSWTKADSLAVVRSDSRQNLSIWNENKMLKSRYNLEIKLYGAVLMQGKIKSP